MSNLQFIIEGGRYMVVDCGGGTVDITVHEITSTEGQLKELFKATGGPYGSVSKNYHSEEYSKDNLFLV